MDTATRDTFFAAMADRGLEEVELPELGMKVYVKSLTPSERMAFCMAINIKDADDSAAARQCALVAAAVCDEGGEPIFEPGDAQRLKDDGNGDVVHRLFERAQLLGGFGGVVEAEAKNSSEPEDSPDSSSG